ncbi:Fc.00g001940.m01.CDS01 [Cosmosporella sp. VM-42]
MASRDEDQPTLPSFAERAPGQGATRDDTAGDNAIISGPTGAIKTKIQTNETISQDRTEHKGYIFSSVKDEEAQIANAYTEGTRMVVPTDDTFLPSKSSDLSEKLYHELRAMMVNLQEQELVPESKSDLVANHLFLSLSRLYVENQALKKELEDAKNCQTEVPVEEKEAAEADPNGTPTFETFHAVVHDDERGGERNFYRDAPRMFKGDTKTDHIRGTSEVEEDVTYLREHPNVSFALIHEYHSNLMTTSYILRREGYRGGILIKDSSNLEPQSKHITLGPAASAAILTILSKHKDRFPGFSDTSLPAYFDEPYILFYLHNKILMELKEESDLDDLAKRSLEVLCQWMEDNCRADWDEADELMAKGQINGKHYQKLFRPKELILWDNAAGPGLTQTFKVAEYPMMHSNRGYVYMANWTFNGSFCENWIMQSMLLQSNTQSAPFQEGPQPDDKVVDITSLNFYPLRFGKEGINPKLVARGLKFWECRRKRLVCYNEPGDENELQAERRYMVDYEMYKRLHPTKDIFRPNASIRSKELVEGKEPPEDDLLACLPATIHAFDFSKKAWRLLRVDRISDVTWNKAAFRRLVAPDETKELIQAVVTAHGSRTAASPDIIEGKGQGLLILLHGGPGTGKTLTAESIAEEQERPLYRVTCGDIGTEPADVERYLGDVLEIGKTWGCVVLLDEADVFLEERSFTDQKRNAIISIFLRVLEYYDGILILTTNRVGSFDEAFKSRIQLALGYPTLDEEDRLKIWRNFVQMLPKTRERIDMDDLEMNLHRLARVEINGRQIRNIITMARHLARFRREMLRYKHMQDAVRSVQKFNEYLSQVKGVSDDDWARADRLR